MKKTIGGVALLLFTFVALMFGGQSAQAAVGPNWTNYHQHVVKWNAIGPLDRYCTYADYRSATGIIIAKHVQIKCGYDFY